MSITIIKEMRTRTTTREVTWNMGLRKFLRDQGWHHLVIKLADGVVTDARTLTDDPVMVEIISEYIKNHGGRDVRE
jgi:hypothetical protein